MTRFSHTRHTISSFERFVRETPSRCTTRKGASVSVSTCKAASAATSASLPFAEHSRTAVRRKRAAYGHEAETTYREGIS